VRPAKQGDSQTGNACTTPAQPYWQGNGSKIDPGGQKVKGKQEKGDGKHPENNFSFRSLKRVYSCEPFTIPWKKSLAPK
jgi:hypothetical protein